jgi:membrane fusion protein (multidrug efflux system)
VSNQKSSISLVGSISVVVATIGVLAGVAFIKYKQVETAMAAPPPPEAPVAVTFATPQPIVFRRSTVTVGTIRAPQSVQLQTELTGVITSIPMVSGSVVDAGTVLVQLDASIEEAQLKGAIAAKQIADSTLRRNREAAQMKAITELEVEQTEASLAQAEAEIERLQALIAKKTLRAPFKSRVGLFDRHVGQYLPEGTMITTLQGVEDFVNIDFSVPQHVGDSIKVDEHVKLLTRSGPLDATVIAIDSQADRISRSLMVRARLQHPPASLQPNDSVKVAVEYGEPITALAIPATAVRRTPTGTLVYLAAPDKTNALRAEIRPIVLFSSTGDTAVVASGLEEGQTIVANGSFKVQENSLLADMNAVPSQESIQGTDQPTDAVSKPISVVSPNAAHEAANTSASTQ